MTTRGDQSRRASGISRWMIAASICAALLAQMASPALHALATGGTAVRGAPSTHLSSALAPSDAGAPAHDPATCPVCQILTRSNPVAMAPITPGEASGAVTPAPPEAPPFACSEVAQSRHRPRAPPFDLLRLV